MTIFELNIFGLTIAPTYYGLMYALWFIIWYFIIHKRGYITWDKLDNLLFYIFLGVILWWRIGYTMFYNFSYYINNLPDIFKIWEWWMSFHWWTIWVIIALIIYAKRNKINIWRLGDEVTAIIPIGLWFWRIWNYLNKELLWYSPYNWPFFIEKGWINYFPSPLLESALEWVVLFIILWLVYTKRKFYWQVAAIFLIFYWIFRIFVEMFFRTPDVQIGYIMWYFTMWEILSLPMIIAWVWIYIVKRNSK
jgi:phosphatidylglycerol:prolipoprotein diacylglycerol transferase